MIWYVVYGVILHDITMICYHIFMLLSYMNTTYFTFIFVSVKPAISDYHKLNQITTLYDRIIIKAFH